MANPKRIILIFICLTAIIIAVWLWWKRSDTSDASLAAIALKTYPGPSAGSTSESKKYSRGYKSGWLTLVAGSFINDNGYIEPPAGEFMNLGIRDGRREAWRSLEKINQLETSQRVRVFKIVHACAVAEIRRHDIINAIKPAE